MSKRWVAIIILIGEMGIGVFIFVVAGFIGVEDVGIRLVTALLATMAGGIITTRFSVHGIKRGITECQDKMTNLAGTNEKRIKELMADCKMIQNLRTLGLNDVILAEEPWGRYITDLIKAISTYKQSPLKLPKWDMDIIDRTLTQAIRILRDMTVLGEAYLKFEDVRIFGTWIMQNFVGKGDILQTTSYIRSEVWWGGVGLVRIIFNKRLEQLGRVLLFNRFS